MTIIEASKTYLVCCAEKSEADKIVFAVANRKQWDFESVEQVSTLVETLKRKPYGGLILGFPIFDGAVKNIIKETRKISGQVPIVLITSNISTSLYKELREIKNLALIDRPLDSSKLSPVLNKIERGEEVFHREHKRFRTNVPAELKKLEPEMTHLGYILNMSKGGAQFRSREANVNRGEVLELNIVLGDLAKKHRLLAEVVWTNLVKENDEEFRDAGLRFMTAESIYDRVLSET